MGAIADLEERVASLTDQELVEMVSAAEGEYEPWALQIGRAEFERRKLAPADVQQLRELNAAEQQATAPPTAEEAATFYFEHKFLMLVGVVAFPYYFVLARRHSRNGNLQRARYLRFIGSLLALMYGVSALRLFAFLLLHH